MRRLAIYFIVLIIFSSFVYAESIGDPRVSSGKKSVLGQTIENMEFPKLKWRIPSIGQEIIRKKLKNGIIVYLYPDHSLPITSINIVFKGGRLYESPQEDQVASLLGSFMKMGGTRELAYEELTEELEFLAASLNVSIGTETGNLSARCLKQHFPRIVRLAHDVLLEPGFREDKLDLIKKQRKENILRQKDYPSWIMSTLFNAQVYGEHPYGRIARVSRIESLAKNDILKAYKQYVTPQRTYIAISGDINARKTYKMLKKLFGNWKSKPLKLPPVQKVMSSVEPGYYIFEKDIPQTNIRIGHLGVKRGNPDEFALEVMNAILGGEAFKSRLDTRVRSDEGLAYSVGSWFGTSTREPSTFGCYAQTRNEKAFRTITIMKETINEMMSKLPTNEEMNQAKETIINSFIHRWKNTRYALNQIMYLEINEYPKDYYQKYIRRVKSVAAHDVLKVAKKYLHPDKMVVVLVGKRSDMKDLPPDIRFQEITLPPEYME